MRKRFSFGERVQAKSMKILAFTNLTLAFPFHELWQILKRPLPKSEQVFIFICKYENMARRANFYGSKILKF